jgi:hypothetical protein
MPRLPIISKYCVCLRSGALASAKLYTIERVLGHAIHGPRRADVEDFVDGWCDIIHVRELRARCLFWIDSLRPRDGKRCTRAAKVRGDELSVFQWRVASPGPTVVKGSRSYCPRNTRMERKILVDILASRAQEYPRNATSDFKASADITNKKKYVDLQQFAAVLLPLPSSVFYPISAFPRQYPGK